ncbi:phosphate starvation-inducible protein PhoH [Pigmentiphaga sp. NML080357]|uniref:PhoH family protein n=1 Tax=Pigmentiphaga sp. NML080357 TaxID=2008675 RepID=UPI000B420B51|nr:PhoH family protein [Pigmentiphaga sp. NML080357]OVZ57566.1 phosphate starvation-inducible protein PhoH [Pigmentiphaga sp. NML080357]
MTAASTRAAHRRAAPVVVTLDDDNTRLSNLCGPLDENLRQLAAAYGVELARRGHRITLEGERADAAGAALQYLFEQADHPLSVDELQLNLVELGAMTAAHDADEDTPPQGTPGEAEVVLRLPRRQDLRGRTPRQRDYLRNILAHDISFGMGPAGTGKTYLAVACAVDALERESVRRIVLTRPAVEAGERLGFLPGDLTQKVDPYLRPLYDALYDLLGFERVGKLFEKQTIEIAPLAYMRGRTLNHAFVILDEAQNTTPEQMKMFLTRIGFGSKAVITGDPSQVDLPRGQRSGLLDASQVLSSVHGISFTQFTSGDVVRHPLVARIVDAYEKHAKTSPGR